MLIDDDDLFGFGGGDDDDDDDDILGGKLKFCLKLSLFTQKIPTPKKQNNCQFLINHNFYHKKFRR